MAKGMRRRGVEGPETHTVAGFSPVHERKLRYWEKITIYAGILLEHSIGQEYLYVLELHGENSPPRFPRQGGFRPA